MSKFLSLRPSWLCLVTIFFLFFSSLHSETITLNPIADAYVTADMPTTNWGDDLGVAIGTHTEIIAYVKFNVGSIPVGSTINTATLRLYCTAIIDNSFVAIARISNSWNEYSVTWNNRPGWEAPVLTSTPCTPTACWWEIDVKNIVSRWVTYGDANYGFYFEKSSDGLVMFNSRESSSNKPQLYINYTPGQFSASGHVKDPLNQGVMCRLHFQRVSGSGSVPSDAYSSVTGSWDQSGFTADETVYRVTPQNLSGDNYTFSPPYRNFSSSGENVSDLNFTATPPAPPPPDPINAIPGPGIGQITLSWGSSSGAIAYVILYDDDQVRPPWDPNPNGNPNSGSDVGNVTSVTIEDLSPGQTYYLTVAAYNAGDLGEFGDTVQCVAKQLESVKLVPPFENAIKSHHSSEIVDIGWTSVGAIPSPYDPETGIIHQQSGIVLLLIGGTVFQVADSIILPFMVPADGVYQVTVYGHFSGNILAAGYGIVEDMKHGVFAVAGIDGQSGDVEVIFNTMPEGLTSGIREITSFGLELITTLIGCPPVICVVVDVILTVNQIIELYEHLNDFTEAIAGFDSDIVLELIASLDKNVDHYMTFYILGQTKAGVDFAYSASAMDWIYSVDSIKLVQTSGTMGPVLVVTPEQTSILPDAYTGVPMDVQNVFTLLNVGDESLLGSASIESGPFSIVSGSEYNLNPGEEASIDINVLASQPGDYTCRVDFTGGGGAERYVYCRVLDQNPVIAVAPSAPVDFDSVIVGSSDTLDAFTIVNTGGGNLAGSVTVDAPFTIVQGESYGLEQGEGQIIKIAFAPMSVGPVSRIVSFTGAGGEERTVTGVGNTQVGVEELPQGTPPTSFALSQNYPNPFNPETRIEFSLPQNSFVTIDIFDILGKRIRRLVREWLSAGYKVVTWDGRNDDNQPVSSGVYIYRIVAGGFTESKKMVLLK